MPGCLQYRLFNNHPFRRETQVISCDEVALNIIGTCQVIKVNRTDGLGEVSSIKITEGKNKDRNVLIDYADGGECTFLEADILWYAKKGSEKADTQRLVSA